MSNVVKKFKNIQEVINSFRNRHRTILKDLLEFAWDLGGQVHKIIEEAAYGEGAQVTLSQELGISKFAASKRYVRALERFKKALAQVPGLLGE